MALEVTQQTADGISRITLIGELDGASAATFRSAIEEAAAQKPRRLVLVLDRLEYMASAGLRVLVFAKQKLGAATEIAVVGVQPQVLETLEMTGFTDSVVLMTADAAARLDA
jgi:anti-anti-sigma factor